MTKGGLAMTKGNRNDKGGCEFSATVMSSVGENGAAWEAEAEG
jgi:hypothetical protein